MFASAVAPIGRRIGRRDGAPQIEPGRERAGAKCVGAQAGVEQLLPCRPCLCRRVIALHQPGGFQRGTSLGPHRQGLRRHRRLRQIVLCQQGTGHQQRGLGDEVVQRRCACHRDIGFASHQRIEPVAFDLRCTQHGATAIGYTRAQRARVGRRERGRFGVGPVQYLQAELQRLQQMSAPVCFRVVTRMGMFEGDSLRGCRTRRNEGQRAL
ncbi:hypothetical protein D3C72_1457810 [compost metagenome]